MSRTASLRTAVERHFGWAWAAGIAMAVATVVLSAINELPIKDPDALIPGYIRFPLIILTAIALDVVPRVVWRSRRAPREFGRHWRAVLDERWRLQHWLFAVGGLSAWYLCYTAFRNLKSMVPYVNSAVWDDEFARIDRVLWFDHDPSQVMHDLFGTGIAAHFFSAVYFIWIALVPVSIAIALVFSRRTQAGSWFVTAVAFDWALGALFYLLLPTLGPVYHEGQRQLFTALPETYNTLLANQLWDDRVAMLADRDAGLQTIAAFPSLHVGIMMTICVFLEYVRARRWVRVTSWVFFVLTVIATMYLGWHFFVDVLGGMALGSFTVWAAAMATGNRFGLVPRLADEPEETPAREQQAAVCD
ncbi:phosphatase PAP2 family protein [Nocardioides sp.]|uniref:phosphatase PAP2 family protein n=1 Tax=Nocardioides sp. TaxID=35761 RepID=UPI003517B534